MSVSLPPHPGRESRRGRRPSPLVRLGVLIVLVVAVFALGIAVGTALHDNPKPGGAATYVRTLKPRPLTAGRETVTVTVREP